MPDLLGLRRLPAADRMSTPAGLYDVTVFCEKIDQSRADAVESAVRAAWHPIHTAWSAPRFDTGLHEMRAVGWLTDRPPEQLAAGLRAAVVDANGRGCEVTVHIEQVITVPGTEFHFGPRGGLRASSLEPPKA